MDTDSSENTYLFNLVQNLGQPSVFPPPMKGKTQASVQFIIPKLKLGNRDNKYINELAYRCGVDVWKTHTQQTSNTRNNKPATFVTFAFYIDSNYKEEDKNNVIMSVSRLLVERFLGILSFLFGMKLSAVHMQYTTVDKYGNYSKILPTATPSSRAPIKITLTDNLKISPSEDVFSALFWLRRGLAERDPIENFSSLMVCLQIMANHLIPEQTVTRTCPSCGFELDKQQLSITQKVLELLTKNLGASKEISERLWKARNAIVAHGNKPVEAKVFLELTELKFEAVKLAYNSIKLGLGIPVDSPPHPNQSYFVTDAFMYID
jgi:hypothetical protein